MRVAWANTLLALFAVSFDVSGADLSPSQWPQAERERLEKLEFQSWSPPEARSVEGGGGLISATISPVAVFAGIQALKAGGTAADAAATTALTQITTQLGSVVSYAGIFTMVYYEAKTSKVYSMDAGYNSYLNETDPLTIPVSDFGSSNASFGRQPTQGGAKGRETLVPGFMEGLDAMHQRFGHLPFKDLFEPAIWYSENGVIISPVLSQYFIMRQKALARTPEGQNFMRQGGGDLPKIGDRFVQPDLATTLKAVAQGGSSYMYTGDWAKEFVKVVQREGGKVTMEDLARYKPIWSEPYKETVFGHTIYTNGVPDTGAYGLFAGLNLAEMLKLDQKGPYWTDAETFQKITRIIQFVALAPTVEYSAAEILRSKSIDVSPAAQLSKPYAEAVAPLLDQLFTPPTEDGPHHSNSIVVVDKHGNIAAITHTINTVIWGDTGIVVGGIPIPDSAGIQQQRLAKIPAGDRVPHAIIDTIVFEGENPVLATAGIGASILPESIRVLFSMIGQHQGLTTVMAAPRLLGTFDPSAFSQPFSQRPVSIPDGAYSAEFVAMLKQKGVLLNPMPTAKAVELRGTLAVIAIDPKTGNRRAVEDPSVAVHSAASD